MTIEQKKNGTTVELAVEGRLDTMTAPQMEATLKQVMDDAEEVLIRFDKLDYLSSAGLRVLLSAHKVMTKKGGKLTISGVNDTVKEVFDVTGFSDILNIV